MLVDVVYKFDDYILIAHLRGTFVDIKKDARDHLAKMHKVDVRAIKILNHSENGGDFQDDKKSDDMPSV